MTFKKFANSWVNVDRILRVTEIVASETQKHRLMIVLDEGTPGTVVSDEYEIEELLEFLEAKPVAKPENKTGD